MKDRITEFLKREGITPAEFADKIGVQRSSVSHVLNGRNFPSASFIQKMLSAYKSLNSRWLLLGEGPVFEGKLPFVKDSSLFNQPLEPEIRENRVQIHDNLVSDTVLDQNIKTQAVKYSANDVKEQTQASKSAASILDLNNYSIDNKVIERIVLFYEDKTFGVYTPSK